MGTRLMIIKLVQGVSAVMTSLQEENTEEGGLEDPNVHNNTYTVYWKISS